MAYDYYKLAQGENGEVRAATLDDAREAVNEALRFRRPDGGVGFNQCLPDTVMAHAIDAGLAGRQQAGA